MLKKIKSRADLINLRNIHSLHLSRKAYLIKENGKVYALLPEGNQVRVFVEVTSKTRK